MTVFTHARFQLYVNTNSTSVFACSSLPGHCKALVRHQQWYEANVGPRWVQTIQFVCRLSQAIADGKVMVKQEFLVVVEVRRAVFSHQMVCGVAIVASL